MTWVLETTTWEEALQPSPDGREAAIYPAYHAHIKKMTWKDEKIYLLVFNAEEGYPRIETSYEGIPSVLAEHGIPEDDKWMSHYRHHIHDGAVWVDN